MNLRVLAVLAVWWWLATQTPSLPSPADLVTPAGSASTTAPDAYAGLFDTAGARHGVDPVLLAAIGHCESGYNPNARSAAGAQGLMQFMPATAASYGIDPWDPAEAIDGAARYLADSTTQLDTTDPALLAASYNAGRGAVTRHGGVPPFAETRRYVECVTGRL